LALEKKPKRKIISQKMFSNSGCRRSRREFFVSKEEYQRNVQTC
jgi:hypothetical protein